MVKLFLTFIFSAIQLSAMVNDQSILQKIPLSDHEFLKTVASSYPEIVRLTEEVRASPESSAIANEHSPSKKLFGVQHIEFDRTAVGILAVKWVLENNYNQLTVGQPEHVKLKQESFNELRASVYKLLEKKKLNALVTSLAFNDLGKVIPFVASVEERTKAHEVDHDNILLIALQQYPDLVPSFVKLNNADQQMILKGMVAQFNLGQFMQAENLPANLKGLQQLCSDELEFNNLHTLFDIAGARGHVESRGSLVLTEPTYQSFSKAFKAMENIPLKQNDASLIQAYDDYLALRCDQFNSCYSNTPENRAIARLACMARVRNANEFMDIRVIFEQLPYDKRQILIEELNKNGITDHGILLYYAPAVIVNAKEACKQNPNEGVKTGICCLADLFAQARAQISPEIKNGVYIVDCAAVATQIKNPEKLNQCRLELQEVGKNARVVLKSRI